MEVTFGEYLSWFPICSICSTAEWKLNGLIKLRWHCNPHAIQMSHFSAEFTESKDRCQKYTMWRCRGILEWTLDSGSKGSGFDSRQCLVLLSFSKTLYPHCCSPPRCINGYPVGCEGYVVYMYLPERQYRQLGKECSLGSGNCAL